LLGCETSRELNDLGKLELLKSDWMNLVDVMAFECERILFSLMKKVSLRLAKTTTETAVMPVEHFDETDINARFIPPDTLYWRHEYESNKSAITVIT
jgi:hypothetical protein